MRVTLELGVERTLRSYFERWKARRREGDVLIVSNPDWCDYGERATPMPPAVERLFSKRKLGDFTGFRQHLSPHTLARNPSLPLAHCESKAFQLLREKTGLPVYGTHAVAEDLPFSDGSLHKIVASNLFGDPSFKAHEEAVAEFNRALAPGGRVELYEDVTPPAGGEWRAIEGFFRKHGFKLRRRSPRIGMAYLAAVKPAR